MIVVSGEYNGRAVHRIWNDQTSTFFGRADIPQQLSCSSINFHRDEAPIDYLRRREGGIYKSEKREINEFG
jgi:hypothetical protein